MTIVGKAFQASRMHGFLASVGVKQRSRDFEKDETRLVRCPHVNIADKLWTILFRRDVEACGLDVYGTCLTFSHFLFINFYNI